MSRRRGKTNELSIAVPDRAITAATIIRLKQSFAAAHERMYGFAVPEERILCVTFRAEALGLVQKAELPVRPLGGGL